MLIYSFAKSRGYINYIVCYPARKCTPVGFTYIFEDWPWIYSLVYKHVMDHAFYPPVIKKSMDIPKTIDDVSSKKKLYGIAILCRRVRLCLCVCANIHIYIYVYI